MIDSVLLPLNDNQNEADHLPHHGNLKSVEVGELYELQSKKLEVKPEE
ncbi:hypothetical protein [Psychromonas sp. SA13A]|nr:hypothetical protein [Psychromonas sp. SA13A]